MRRGLPIYGKVLAWLLVNVLLLTVLVLGFLRMQFHMSLDWMLVGPAGDRISMIGDRVTGELSHQPESEWPAALKGYEKSYGVTFALLDRSGTQVMGAPLQIPADLRPKVTDKRPAGEREGQRRPPPRRPPDAVANPAPGAASSRPPDAPPKPRFMQRTGDPARYWAGIHLDLTYGPDFVPLTLVMVSDKITGGGLFIDLWPWAGLAAACLGLSAIVWMPFVSGLTRSIGRMNKAARNIAQGNFNERVPDKRNDELGELSSSVNAMASQLGDYVEQQRRITADVAHELCSPIARMQMAVGVIQQRGTPEQATYLEKIDRELQHMAKLVEEVLSFTKAAHLAEQGEAEDFDLRQLVTDAVAREAAESEVVLDVPEMKMHTHRDALERAVSNIVRNAVRYAGSGGPIEVRAAPTDGNTVEITIRDHGPGVPADALDKIFDAFFRVDPARGRGTGGAGLGLAIVKRCVAACRGHVSASLPDGGGLQLTVRVPTSI